jgi:very-short-patch-repair endonuclease
MNAMPENELDPSFFPEPSHVRLVFAQNIDEFLFHLKSRVEEWGGEYRLVSIVLDRLPALRSLIDGILDRLADVAFSLYPGWFGEDISFNRIESSHFSFDRLLRERLDQSDHLRRVLSLPWLRAARRLCRSGKAPIPRDFPASIHAAQLALAIDPGPLVIALCLRQEETDPGGLLGLARTAEWLARETNARLLVVVPETQAPTTELESIDFEAVGWSPRPDCRETESSREVNFRICPIIGRPHPFSPGEQLLAKRLANDEMLSRLFQFNIHVTTKHNNRYLVDLVWIDGRIVVEVDGYEFHSDRHAFSLDRRRDYELLISGYLVLRLPHDEIVEDAELAVEKIRDVVLFRRNGNHPESDAQP